MGQKQMTGRKRLANPNPLSTSDVILHGHESSRRVPSGQMQLPMELPQAEQDYDRMATPLRRWTDLSDVQRTRVSSTLKDQYGVTMANAVHNHGALIDQALREGPQGQRFYAGESDDSTGSVGRDAVVSLARKHGMPTHVVAAVRGVLSPRNNVHDELVHTDAVLSFMKENPKHEGPVPGIVGLAATGNTTKATALVRAHMEGAHPLDAEMRPGHKIIDPQRTPKVASYVQGYTHPDEARATIDTHAVAGMAPHLPKSAPRAPTNKIDQRTGKPFMQPVNKSHPEWTPNHEDVLNVGGAYEFFAHAAEEAASRRGLTASEAQSVAWHVERVRGGNVQPGTGNARSRQRGPVQGNLFP